MARGDLGGVRLLVDTALAAPDPLEVLDGVGHVGEPPVDLRVREALVEEPSGGADERPPLLILAVAGLLAHEQNARLRGAFAEDGLSARLPERAGAAVRCGAPQLG